jgi:hypothetical protein
MEERGSGGDTQLAIVLDQLHTGVLDAVGDECLITPPSPVLITDPEEPLELVGTFLFSAVESHVERATLDGNEVDAVVRTSVIFSLKGDHDSLLPDVGEQGVGVTHLLQGTRATPESEPSRFSCGGRENFVESSSLLQALTNETIQSHGETSEPGNEETHDPSWWEIMGLVLRSS